MIIFQLGVYQTTERQASVAWNEIQSARKDVFHRKDKSIQLSDNRYFRATCTEGKLNAVMSMLYSVRYLFIL